MSHEIIKEILLHLRIRMSQKGSQAEFEQIVKVLQMILANLVKDPADPKFHTLRLANPKIQQFVGSHVECINLLEILGFQELHDVVSKDEGLQVVLQIPLATVLENYDTIKAASTILTEIQQKGWKPEGAVIQSKSTPQSKRQ